MKIGIVSVLMATILPMAGIAASEAEFTVSLWAKLARFPDPNGDRKKGETQYGLFSDNWDVRMAIDADRRLTAQVTVKGDKAKGEKDLYYTLGKPLGQNLRTNEWNHYAVTWSVKAGEMTLFFNGAAVDRRTKDVYGKVGVTPVDCHLDNARVGSLAGGWASIKGETRGFRIVREALSAEGIAAAEAGATASVAAESGLKGVTLPKLAEARQKARASAADARLGRGRPLYWCVVDPMGIETYLPDSDLPEESLFKPLLVCAAKGEYEAASLVVRPLVDLKGVVPVVSELRTKDGAALPASIVDSRIVKVAVMSGGGAKNRHIRVRKPVYLLHDDALLRCDFEKMESYIRLDRLEGAVYEWITKPGDSYYFEQYKSAAEWPIHDAKTIQPLDLKAGFGQQFWFTFHVPRDAKPGLYRGEVDFASGGKSVAKVPVKLRVLPFELPEPRTSYDLSRKMYAGVYWRSNEINFDNPSKPGSITSCGRTVEQVRAELRNMKAHGILYPTVVMAFPNLPGWSWNVYNKPEAGGKERVMTAAGREYFMRAIALLKSEGFPMDKLFLHTGGNFGFRTFYDPAKHRDILRRAVAETLALVREAVGCDTDVQFYGVDEAYGDALKAEYVVWSDIHEFGGRVFTTCVRSHTVDVAGHVDTQIASGVPDRRFSKMQHDVGGLIWNYANPQAGAKDRARPYRVNFGFGVYGENYDGFATYAWNVSAEHPWNDFDNRVEPDLAFVIPTADGVVDTPSWEGYREGVDDIRYATLLRRLCRARPGPKADEATRFLDAINAYKLDFDSGYTRLKIVDYILDLL